MKIIKNDLKEIREKLICEHLLNLNENNDTFAVELDNLDVRIYSTSENDDAIIYLKKEFFHRSTCESVELYSPLIISYDLNERYRLIFNADDTFTIKTLD
ncbi:hypothetical protein [Desulfosporosinus hippei]|uniref:Uncharacterized protein n=1 Tax=Desulfosporosinus hippei DSM 8344 TaxID=1121419 RepID=A0A1G7VGI8_9FIRM|nr:hypothetical protein [Desulfosporosinus hippei]SDG58854.1 hypothetical protein SAMN05443529_104117 [Desulfosporosinus hippei DSM 8344]